MALIQSYKPTIKFGYRYATSLAETFSVTFPQALADDSEVQKYVWELKQDPAVKLVNGALNVVGYYSTTALKMANSFANTLSYPITYPLSRIIKRPEFKLTPCPFPPAKIPKISGQGFLVLRENNPYDNLLIGLKNLTYKAELSKNIFFKLLFGIIHTASSIKERLASAIISKDELVLMTIQQYFPTFEEGEFLRWLNSSFLPCLTQYYIRGLITSLKSVAEVAIVQERQMQISDYVISGLLLRSKLLSIHDAEIVELDFKGHLPVITVRYSADYIDHVITRKGRTVIGGPECVKQSAFMVILTINDSGPEPVWKACEVHIDGAVDKI